VNRTHGYCSTTGTVARNHNSAPNPRNSLPLIVIHNNLVSETMAGFYAAMPISQPLGEHPRAAPALFSAAPPVFNAATALVAPLLVALPT
jgi:hypothetical protein